MVGRYQKQTQTERQKSGNFEKREQPLCPIRRVMKRNSVIKLRIALPPPKKEKDALFAALQTAKPSGSVSSNTRSRTKDESNTKKGTTGRTRTDVPADSPSCSMTLAGETASLKVYGRCGDRSGYCWFFAFPSMTAEFAA